MYRGHIVAIVVPAYNEERHIGSVITTMPEFVDHIVVVDDASTDRTSEAAESVVDPRLTLVRHERNTGVGGAVVTGHRQALATKAEVVGVMAGDGQTDPQYLHLLLDAVIDDRCDMAKANRFFSIDSFEGMPRHRIFGNIVLSFLSRLASGYWHIFDVQNGYLAMKRGTLERLPLHRIARGYPLENDVLIHLNIIDARVLDVPIPARYGEAQSSIRLRAVIPAMLNLLFRGFWRRVFWKYVIWSFSPIAMFLFAGLLLSAWGIGFGIYVLIHTLGPQVATTGSVLLSVGPLLVGIQFLISFLLLDIQESRDRR